MEILGKLCTGHCVCGECTQKARCEHENGLENTNQSRFIDPVGPSMCSSAISIDTFPAAVATVAAADTDWPVRRR